MGNMLGVDTKLNSGNVSLGSEYCTFGIVKSSTEIYLRFPDNSEFGLLNSHISKALLDLIDRPSIQFDAIASTLTLRETIGRAVKESDAVVRVDINVYGSTDASEAVGRHLSTHHVYLQRPDRKRPGSVYDNPHVLKFADMQMPSHEHQLELVVPRVSTSGDAEQFRQTVSKVYASLTRGTKLNRVEGDRRLGTQLLP
jgi:SWI/SNF-related matrix-associated actin-dependent regulator of chromatin subfamily A3